MVPFYVIPAPQRMRDKLQQESSNFKLLWNPAFAKVAWFLTFSILSKGDEIVKSSEASIYLK